MMTCYLKSIMVFMACVMLSLFYCHNSALLYSSYADVDNRRPKERARPTRDNQTKRLLAEDILINTPGCFIPNYGMNLEFISPQHSNDSCGLRAIYIKALGSDKIVFEIDKAKMGKYVKNKKWKLECCYQFATRSKAPGRENSHLIYSRCIPFKDGTKAKLLQEVISISCAVRISKKKTEKMYDDVFIMIKKIKIKNRENVGKSWNVLILGMDSMSRARVYKTMPHTVRYLREHNWLDYKGYQKVAYDTSPNQMSVLTGNDCRSDLQQCMDNIIWRKLKNIGYVTALGEDHLLPTDTIIQLGYKASPTDHYVRPLFVTGENRFDNIGCIKKLTSAKHLLNYAHQFAHSYNNENFFGMFWINSNSRHLQNIPSVIDADIVDFFQKLYKTDVLNNTFVIFLSDHGMNFGQMKTQIESYYEERLPMLFMWVPFEFRKLNMKLYHNSEINQNRLATPYDLYATLADMLNLSNYSTNDTRSETCPQCASLFKEHTPHRTCADAGVEQKWCSCHNITEVKQNKTGVKLSIMLAVSHIINKAKLINTIPCMECHDFKLKSVLRTHSYKHDNKTHYVIAFQMSPGDVSYEATVYSDGKILHILQPMYSLTSYNTRGNCVINPIDRDYCVCKITKCVSARH